jgi:chemotaxis regulatin CheY-phosphate phosphatase CheZ
MKEEELLKEIEKITEEIFEANDRLYLIDISLDAYNLLLKLPQVGGHTDLFKSMIGNIKDNWNHLKNDSIDESTFVKYRNRMWSDIGSAVTAFKMYSKQNKF